MHLIVDGYGADPATLQDEEVIYQFLDHYPTNIGMTKVTPPYVFKYAGSDPLDWGVSGFVLIAESHISIHTFPDRGYVNVDIFSCKEFDAEQAIKDLTIKLGLAEVRSYTLKRGLEYYKLMEREEAIRKRLPLSAVGREG